MSAAFTHADLPHLGKRVLRLGVAGNYGLETADLHHAAERGVGFWLWSPRFRAELDENLAALHDGPLSSEEDAWIREYGRQVKARRKISYL